MEVVTPGTEDMSADDAAWALTCAFLILTMQTGFAMLECGTVSPKNVANIMVKNVVDVTIGGSSYWMFGYALSFGDKSNAFMGYSEFFYHVSHDEQQMGSRYAKYFFQFSFATTATTIVSGAVAERIQMHAYMAFSFINTVIYCLPACWAWNTGDKPFSWDNGFQNNTGGFLYRLGFFDFAGVCVVHLCGGVSAFIAAFMLGPRTDRFEKPELYKMSSPVTSLTGMFMLWWAWLGFNCGSTFGVTGNLWKVSALVAVTTLNGAIGGGCVGMIVSISMTKGKILIDHSINSILGGLVSITGVAACTTPAEALAIGAVGGGIAILAGYMMEALKIDDPVGAAPVHLFAATWGTLAVGIFGKDNSVQSLRGLNGWLHGGGLYLLGIQTLAIAIVIIWAGITTFISLFVIDKAVGIRMSREEEALGADWVEHAIYSSSMQKNIKDAVEKSQQQHNRKTTFAANLERRINAKTSKINPVTQGHQFFSVDSNSRHSPRPIDTRRNINIIDAQNIDDMTAGGRNLSQPDLAMCRPRTRIDSPSVFFPVNDSPMYAVYRE